LFLASSRKWFCGTGSCLFGAALYCNANRTRIVIVCRKIDGRRGLKRGIFYLRDKREKGALTDARNKRRKRLLLVWETVAPVTSCFTMAAEIPRYWPESLMLPKTLPQFFMIFPRTCSKAFGPGLSSIIIDGAAD